MSGELVATASDGLDPGEYVDETSTELPDGVIHGKLSGDPTVTSKAADESAEPRDAIAAVDAGDTIRFEGELVRVISVGRRVNFNQRGVYRFTLSAEDIGTASTLYVDRDPYLLNICNGPVRAIAPQDVQPTIEESNND